MAEQQARGAGNGAPPLFLPGRVNVYPPRERGPWCIVCFAQGAGVERFEGPPFGGQLQPELQAKYEQLQRIRSLCGRCRPVLESGSPEDVADLFEFVHNEMLSSGIDATVVASAFLEADLGFAFARWSLRGLPFGRLSPGMQTWRALLARFPVDRDLKSVVERDLGNGVYGTFATFMGGLWIDNLVSRDRGKGYASAALAAICDVADEHRSFVFGKVEPNAPTDVGLPIGLPLPALLAWYARIGFERMPSIGAIMVMRRPRPRGRQRC